jgi:hypothetical protein
MSAKLAKGRFVKASSWRRHRDRKGGRMSVTRESRLPTPSAWQLEFGRLIAFPVDPPVFMNQHWWTDLTSEQPDDFVSTRKKHTREDRGGFQGAVLALTVDLSRVEWLVQPSGEFGESSGKLPTLGPLRDKVDWFVELLSPWLANSCPPLVRLAFAGKLLQAAATPLDAYRILSRHLPAVNLDSNPNDFLLQINRRKNSTVVDGLPINRISSWSKLNVAFSVEPGKPLKWPETSYGAVELDINTAPDWPETLPPKLLPRLFRELASLAVENAERGDIP